MQTDTVDDSETGSVNIECELPQPPEKVWRVLTEPDLLAEWLLPNDMVPDPGHRFRLQAAEESAIDCEVIEVEPCRRLAYRWRRGDPDKPGALDSLVTFELDVTAAGGTRLRVTHSGLPVGLQPRRGEVVAMLGAGAVRRRNRGFDGLCDGGILQWAA